MLIDDYEIEMETPGCDLDSGIYTARVALASDISEVLPYINATVEKGDFVPGLPALVWKEGGRKYALRPREIAISNITDRNEASGLVSSLVRRINNIWEDRENLEPSYATWEKPKVLDLLRLLPGTNCKECGVPTCMAYANKLAEGKASLEDCPRLSDEERAEQLSRLREMGL